jgi:hypothetical protein
MGRRAATFRGRVVEIDVEPFPVAPTRREIGDSDRRDANRPPRPLHRRPSEETGPPPRLVARLPPS